jgi:hypothetical protein
MKTYIVSGFVTLFATSLLAADTNQTDVSNAAQALAAKPNYSWKTTVTVPPDSQFQPAPTEGKTEKGGFTFVSTSMRDNEVKFALKGDKSVVHTEDNGWQLPSEMDDQGPGRFLGAMVRNFQTPAMQATNLLASAKELKKDNDIYSSDLTEAGAKSLLTFRRGGDATVSNAKGSEKFWVTDGVLTKFEFKVTGTVSFNGNDREVDRDTTVEIKDVGTTKVEVPDDAKKKLQ